MTPPSQGSMEWFYDALNDFALGNYPAVDFANMIEKRLSAKDAQRKELEAEVERQKEIRIHNDGILDSIKETNQRNFDAWNRASSDLQKAKELLKKAEDALALRFDEDGRCFVCGFNVGGCADTCEASIFLADLNKEGK